MSSQYENLVKCCGGVITPESVEQFQRTMIEYEAFLGHMRQLLAPGGMIIEVIERAPGDL